MPLYVAIGLSDGSLLEEFEIPHILAEGFRDFFARVFFSARDHENASANRHGRLQSSIHGRWTALVRAMASLFNVNNLAGPTSWRSLKRPRPQGEYIDSRKTLGGCSRLRDHLPMAGEVLQEVMATPEENNDLKRLSRSPAPAGE